MLHVPGWILHVRRQTLSPHAFTPYRTIPQAASEATTGGYARLCMLPTAQETALHVDVFTFAVLVS